MYYLECPHCNLLQQGCNGESHAFERLSLFIQLFLCYYTFIYFFKGLKLKEDVKYMSVIYDHSTKSTADSSWGMKQVKIKQSDIIHIDMRELKIKYEKSIVNSNTIF